MGGWSEQLAATEMRVWHYLYLPDRGAAERVARHLHGAAYATDVHEVESRWLVRAQHTVPASPKSLERIADALTGLAAKEGGDYDGWEREAGTAT